MCESDETFYSHNLQEYDDSVCECAMNKISLFVVRQALQSYLDTIEAVLIQLRLIGTPAF